MKFIKENILLILIIVLAILLRFVNLSSIPVGFNDDEAAFGYNAYSILKTGRDEWGKLLPFPVFESFGDWKLISYLYLTVISQFFLGLNEFATRAPSATVGVLAVVATYLFAKELFKNSKYQKQIALLSAFLLAISPWHVVASRNAFESDLLVATITMAAFFFLKAKENSKYLTLCVVFFALSLYIYRSSWLFVPIYTCILFLSNKDHFLKNKKDLAKNSIFAFILIIPLIPAVLTFKGQSRFLQESFVASTARIGINNDINEKRGACAKHTSAVVCTVFYNKLVALGSTYVTNYANNLSYQTYFANANPTGFQSFSTRSAFYLFELPFLLLGIYFLLSKGRSQAKVLFPWLLLMPIGASFAGVGNFGRINILMPAPQIIAAFGVVTLIGMFRQKQARYGFIILLSSVVLFSVGKFTFDMFFTEPYFNSRYQRYGYKDLFLYLKENESKYDNIVISRKIDNSHQYMQYLYFSQVNPKYNTEQEKRTKDEYGWTDYQQLGKYYFLGFGDFFAKLPEKTVFVAGEGEINIGDDKPIHIVRDLRGDPVFLLYESEQIKAAREREQAK